MMRLEVLYRPRTAAAEYSRGYALNMRNTCMASCRYCSAPQTIHKAREDYHKAGPLKEDLVPRLERDLVKIGKQSEPIFMSFIGDPFEQEEHDNLTTLTAVATVIHDSGNRIRFLTKQIMQHWFSYYIKPGDELGVTLTCANYEIALLWESGTASPPQRIENLRRAHDAGYLTWASCEPVINPAWTLELIERAAAYADVFAIGKANHLASWQWPSEEERQRVSSIDWTAFLFAAKALIDRLGKIAYYKTDLLNAANVRFGWGQFSSLDGAIRAWREINKPVDYRAYKSC